MELSIDMYGSLQSALANTETDRRLGLICNAVIEGDVNLIDPPHVTI